MTNQYKISTIIPVYNVEPYLEETIKSIIHQTIGFKKNIQLILINDGSTDKSETICLKYKKQYPENILYVAKKNEGVSVARNLGLQFARGNYINFLDSDDYLDLDFYQKAYQMLEENKQIDLVAARLKYFEASEKYHWLDYKFTSDRIIDIKKEPESILLHMSTALIRAQVIKKLKFDPNLKVSEDTKLLYEIILQKEKYGILASSIYHYRKRKDGSSAIQTSNNKRDWYTDTIKYCHDYLIKLSMQKYGVVIPYVQHFIMYNLQWRIKTKIADSLTEKEKINYVNTMKKHLSIIDDNIILFQKQMKNSYKLLALKVKYGKKLEQYLKSGEDGIYFKEQLFIPYNSITNNVQLAHIEKGKLIVEGNIILYNFPLYYTINGEKRVEINTYLKNTIDSIFEPEYDVEKYGYLAEIPLENVHSLEFQIKVGENFYTIKNRFLHFSRINNFKAGYYYDEKYLITKKNNLQLQVECNPLALKVFGKELYFLGYIILKRKQLKIAFMRMLYWLTKPFMPKNIWLFSDREFMGRDSGELLFRYTNKQPQETKRNTYFLLDKHYEDYNRMKQYGKVISYHTMKYRLFFLNAKYIISSHADSYVNNAFGKARKYYVDLFHFEYIYLTHGILLHDSSAWLNRINKNIALNVVTSPIEYEALLDGSYYFKPEQLMKTGLPRHDNLMQQDIKEENKILIMASWRSSLAGCVIPGTQRRAYNPKFKKSEYFQFYDRLFQDKRLIETLQKYRLQN